MCKNNEDTIDLLLSTALKEIGYNNYEECYEKVIGVVKMVETNQATKIEIGTSFIESTDKKYPALRTIIGIYKVCGWLVAIATIVVAAIFGKGGIAFIIIIIIIIGSLIVLGVFAAAESIMVFIDIEKNTKINNKQK